MKRMTRSHSLSRSLSPLTTRASTLSSIVLVAVSLLVSGCEDKALVARAESLAKEVDSLKGKINELESEKAAIAQRLSASEKRVKSLEEAARTADKKELIEETAAALGIKPGTPLFATFKTSMGDITVELFWEKVPKTVRNFVELAEGKKPWTDPKTQKQVTTKLYDGTIFHRVIPNFMIQGGDPMGTGMGGPGYKFADEFVADLKHDAPGTLSMANSGPNTNGSQFFITEVPTPHLDGRHTVFGRTISGTELVGQITRVEKAAQDRPKTDVVLKSVVIGRGQAKK